MTCVLAAIILLTGVTEPSQQLVAVNAGRAYVEADAAAVIAPATIPSNIEVPVTYQPIVNAMLNASATFRRQCARIGRSPWLHVTIERSVLPRAEFHSAMTVVTRDPAGHV